jgi:GntR family transcriptional regulator
MNYKNGSLPSEQTKLPSFNRISDTESLKLHEVVRKKISEAILSGRWGAGEVLPGETALADNFGVSVGTVRKALSALTAEGMLMRRRKTGTVVTGWAPQLHNLSHFYQYFRLHGKDGKLLKSKAVLFDYAAGQADAREIEKLDLAATDQVIRLKRVRYIGERPAMIDFYAFPAKLIPGFPEKKEVPELLYLFLFEKYGIRIAAVRENITAELAGTEVAGLLGIGMPHAILKFEEIAFDHAARPVIFSIHHANTTDFQYINEIR